MFADWRSNDLADANPHSAPAVRQLMLIAASLVASLFVSCAHPEPFDEAPPPGPPPETTLVTDVDTSMSPTPKPFMLRGGPPSCPAPGDAAPAHPAAPTTPLPLRGDPDFHPADLSAESRAWYVRLWSAIHTPEQNRTIVDLAQSDDLYQYGRWVHTHLLALLTAFRVTGDLSLLDEVDRLTSFMRAQLADASRGTIERSSGEKDGYLNWVWRADEIARYTGKDVHGADEMRTHALIAEVAWAFHNNRDLASPNDVDYAERADFWSAYLTSHFEAKWRERNNTSFPNFPFLEREHMHETVSFIKYHHYLAKLLKIDHYAQEARRLTERVQEHFVSVTTDDGAEALVWPRSLVLDGGSEAYLMPTTYARYVFGDAVDLHLDGADDWADKALMDAMAVTVQAYILDDERLKFARDVGGGIMRGGIPASDPERWGPFTADKFRISPLAFVARWEESGILTSTACELDLTAPDALQSVHLPAALLVATTRP